MQPAFHFHPPIVLIREIHGRRKVLNIGGGGGKVQNIAGCKLIGASVPKSVPNNYISHTEYRYNSKIKKKNEKYTFRNTFK